MSLRNQVISSLKWVTFTKIIAQLFKWASTFIVIRLLLPSDYGVVAITEIIFSFLLMLSIDGFGAPLIQKKQLNEQLIRDVFGSLIVLNIVIFIVIQYSAPYIASYYEMPQVEELIRLLSLGLILITFIIIPSSLLSKKMKFKQKSLIELVSSVIAASVTVVLAYLEFGAYSLIYGHLALLLSKAILLNIIEPCAYKPSLSFARSKKIYQFGSMVTLSGILWFFYTNIDVMIAGKAWSPELLGIYVVAVQLTVMPIDKIMPMVQSVAFPAYSSISSDDKERIKNYSLKSVRLMMFLILPVYMGIASIASVLIPVVLGDKWNDAILPVMLLCTVMPFRVLFEMYDPLFTSLGKMRFVIENILIMIAIMVPAFFIGVQYSVLGLCIAWMVVYPIVVGLIMVRILNKLEIEKFVFLREILPTLLISISMFLSVYLFSELAVGTIEKIFVLIVSIILGAAVYVGLSLLFNKKTVFELRAMLGR